jgi:hypothetical protein
MNHGEMLSGPWEKGKMDMDMNCYYDVSGQSPKFLGHDFAEWQKQHDTQSIVTDPGFRDAAHYDFRFKHRKAARKIGFEPFDYSRAGVYGTEAWKAKARMEQAELDAFSQLFR